MAIILFITGIIIFFVMAGYVKNYNAGFILPFVLTLTCLGGFIYLSTEILNIFNALTTFPVLIAWMLLAFSGFIIWWRNGKYIPKYNLQFLTCRYQKGLFYAILFILGVTLITALFAYPNNWDSMTYHLGRVMQWKQHHNVAQYPTQIDRQITQPPLAEYAILHLQILSNNDRLANLIQWLFFAGNIGAAALLASAAGANTRTQLLAAFFVATIPMAILQSNSTQNDLVVAFFVMMAILFALLSVKNQFSFYTTGAFYLVCALALLCKGTAFIYLLPVVLFFGLTYLIKKKLAAMPSLIFGLMLVATLYFPFAYRNYEIYKSPLGKSYELNNEVYTIGGFISNVSKNATMHLRTPVPAINDAITNGVIRFNKLIGVDVNAPKYNWAPSPDFEVGYFSAHEDAAGNFLQVLLFAFALVWMLVKRKNFSGTQKLLAGLILIMFLLFCFVLKWQIWHVRLHLLLFIAGAVLFAIVIEQTPRLLSRGIALITFLFSLIFLFYNQSRPLIGANNIFTTPAATQYFASNKLLQHDFMEVNTVLQSNNCNTVAFISGGDSWEYPFWRFNNQNEDFSIYQIRIKNETSVLEAVYYADKPLPDAIINVRGDEPLGEQFDYKKQTYSLVRQQGIYAVYLKTLLLK